MILVSGAASTGSQMLAMMQSNSKSSSRKYFPTTYRRWSYILNSQLQHLLQHFISTLYNSAPCGENTRIFNLQSPLAYRLPNGAPLPKVRFTSSTSHSGAQHLEILLLVAICCLLTVRVAWQGSEAQLLNLWNCLMPPTVLSMVKLASADSLRSNQAQPLQVQFQHSEQFHLMRSWQQLAWRGLNAPCWGEYMATGPMFRSLSRP